MLTPSLLIAAACVAGTPAVLPDWAGRLAILDVQTTGIDQALVPLLTEVLTAEVHALDFFEVIAGRDIDAMLGLERSLAGVGCDDPRCFVELGSALRAERLLVGHVGMLGNMYIVNIKLIDLREVRTVARVYETVSGELEVLIGTIRTSVRKLFSADEFEDTPDAVLDSPATDTGGAEAEAEADQMPGRMLDRMLGNGREQVTHLRTRHATEAAARAEVERDPMPLGVVATEPSRLPPIGVIPVTLWSIGAVGIVAGAVMGYQAIGHRRRVLERAPGSQIHAQQGRNMAIAATVSIAGGAVSAVAGLVVWLTSGRPEKARGSALPLTPVGPANTTGATLNLEF